MSKYLIQVLDSPSFDKLPYKYTNEAVGVTDTNEKKIYVRNMGNTSLNHDVIEHEIDEASNNFHGHESPDEVGIKYGWFSKFLKQTVKHIGSWAPQTAGAILTAMGMPMVGVPLAAAGGGVHAYQSDKSLGSVAGGAVKGGLTAYGGGKALAGGIKGATAAAPGFLSKAGGAVAGAGAGLGLPGFGEGGAASGFLKGATTGVGAVGSGAATATGAGTGAVAPNAAVTSWTPSGAAGPVTMGQTGALPSIGQTAAGAVGKKSLLKTMAGFALPMVGNALAGTPEMPDSAKVAGLEGRLQEGGGQVTDIGSLGVEKLTERLGTPWTGLPDDYKAAIKADFDQPYQDAKDNLIRQYKQLRPGADIENDSAFRKDMMRLEGDFAKEISNKMVQLEQEEKTNYLNRQSQDIRDSLNLDEQTFNRYADIAQLDLDQLMLQFGLDYSTASSFKDIFGQYGGMLMQQGMGL